VNEEALAHWGAVAPKTNIIQYRVNRIDCRNFKNLSYTIHFREEYAVSPIEQEILKGLFYDALCAVVMHFSAWSAVY